MGRAADAFQILRHVQIGFIQRQRLDQGRIIGKDRADLARYLAIDLETRRHEDQLRTQTQRLRTGHGRSDPEHARLVTGRRDHAARAGAADRHGLALQAGVVALFHAGEKGVHVDMDDLAQAIGLLAVIIVIGRGRFHSSIQ
jgi:hypothetical protein